MSRSTQKNHICESLPNGCVVGMWVQFPKEILFVKGIE